MHNRRVPLDKRRFLTYDSDRSGFEYFKLELVKDGNWWVHPDEFDEPPPSKDSLGGEGEMNRADARENSARATITLKDEDTDF